MNKLIIGCGYLGKRIARKWIAQGDRVIALTRSADRASEFRRMGICPKIGDITDPDLSFDSTPFHSVLYAIGFDRFAGKSRQDVTVKGLTNLLGKLHGKIDRFLYISTTSVYATDDGSWVDVDSPCRPISENGLLALEAESIVGNFCNSPAVSSGSLLRLSGIYGRGRLLARRQSLLDQALLPGNPHAWLNLIHVDDAAEAILACESHHRPNETYLVSDDSPIRRREYYSLLAQLIHAPEPGYESNPNDLLSLNKRCDNRRTKSQLNWKPRFPNIRLGLPDALIPE